MNTFLINSLRCLLGLLTVVCIPSAFSLDNEVRIGPYVIGEVVHYAVSWGLIGVGEGTFETDLVTEEGGDELIRLRFTSQSKGVANAIYPVDDCIDAFIHPTTLLPVRVEKQTREGDFLCDSSLLFDYDQKKVIWEDRQGGQTVECDHTLGATDFYSLLYRLRSMDVADGTNRVQVVVDAIPHQLDIFAGESKTMKVQGRGNVPCQNIIIESLTEGLFVRKIPSDVWVTLDEPRVLAAMKIKVPVGSVSIRFDRREILN